MSYKKIAIKDLSSVYYSLINVNRGEMTYLALVGEDKVLKLYEKELNKNNSIRLDNEYLRVNNRKYQIYKKKIPNSNYTHLIAIAKDSILDEKTDNPRYVFDVHVKHLYDSDEELHNQFYNKIYTMTPIPLLREWVPYILRELRLGSCCYSLNNPKFNNNEDYIIETYSFDIRKNHLLAILKRGLEEGHIIIRENAKKSELIDSVTGLDSYLNLYGEILAEKIQNAFVPKYTPGEEHDRYVNNFEDYCFHKERYLFDAQTNAIQAVTTHLRTNTSSIVVGEMGSGKTIIGSGVAYAISRKKVGSVNIVLCPSHLVRKWQREIELYVPNGKAYIVSDISEMVDVQRNLNLYKRIQHTFIIISKESSKLSYEEMPSAIFKNRTKHYYCPECGELLTKEITDKHSKEKVKVPLTYMDLLKKSKDNEICRCRISKNSRRKKKDNARCNSKLWGAFNKDAELNWLKFGKLGWINKYDLNNIYMDLQERIENNDQLSRFERNLFSKLEEYLLNNEGQLIKAPRRYSLAKYIRENMKNQIDLFIVDECHQYKGLSEQGKAMYDISLASKKMLCLTGTLVNGYADGIFYILFRTNPKLMRKEGFEFNDSMNFVRTYGVVEKTTSYYSSSRSTNEKKLPGVSPLVFTNFLLENTLFLSLSDMDGGLPAYEEIPIKVEMTPSLTDAYRNVENFFTNNLRDNYKIIGQLFRTLTAYPDYPFDYPEIHDPVTGELLFTPQKLEDELLPKEQELLRLLQEKKENNEKTLIYLESINTVPLIERLVTLLENENIKTEVLTANVKAKDREDWIYNIAEDVDVLICNPKLVETGLDLLPFTSIIFFQTGDNIYVMRQASRRSYRLSQIHNIKVYFLYYENTMQESALSLMASKLQSSMAIEGKFNEEGLAAMSNNEDFLTAIASSVVEGIKNIVNVNSFCNIERSERVINFEKYRVPMENLLFLLPKITYLKFLEEKRQEKRKEKSLNKTMKEFFSNTASIVNYY